VTVKRGSRKKQKKQRGKKEYDALWIMVGLFVFAFILRLIYIHQIQRSPLFDFPAMDARYHDDWARAILSGRGLGREAFFRAPLYPYVLALIYRLTDYSKYVPRLFQALLGAGSCVWIYAIGRRLFNRSVALAAGLAAAVYGILIYYDGELLIPTLIVFLDLALLYSLLTCSTRPGVWRFLIAGALMGLSAIARPNILFFGLFVVIWIFYHFRKSHLARRRGLWVTGFAIGVLLFVLPITVRNTVIGNDFVFIASQAGINFYIGNNPHSDGATAIAPGMRGTWWGGYEDAIRLAEEAEGRELKPSEVSNHWLREGFTFMAEHPGNFIMLLARKLILFWQGYEIPNNQEIYFFGSYSPLFRLLVWRHGIAFPFGLLAPLALVGIFLVPHRSKGIDLLIGFVGTYMTSIILFFVCARYRVPVIGVLLLLAAAAVASMVEWSRRRNWGRLAISLGLFIPLLIVSNVDFFRIADFERFQSYFMLGRTLERAGRPDEAVEMYRTVIRLNPRFPDAYVNLGSILGARNQFAEAIQEYRMAIEIDPNHWAAHNNLGNLYARMGMRDKAIPEFLIALGLMPDQASTHNNLANAYLEENEYEKALQHYEEAIRLGENDPRILYNVGMAYARMGRMDRAKLLWERTALLDPTYRDVAERLHVMERAGDDLFIATDGKLIPMERYKDSVSVERDRDNDE
jgi:Tfp pilus assembly protein PilF/4-amino-4-deoxy-L-arabinose transferase-like glycosyltransferase